MEAEGSSACSQEPVTCSCPEPDDPSHTIPFCFFSLRFTLIASCHLRLCPLGFPSKSLAPFLLRMRHMPRPCLRPWCDHVNSIWWGAQIMNLPAVQCCPSSCYFFLAPNIFLSTMFLTHSAQTVTGSKSKYGVRGECWGLSLMQWKKR